MLSMAVAADAGYSIFLRTRSAVTEASYPRRLDYTIFVSGLESDTPKANHYHVSCDPGDGTIRILPVSDEELASPPPQPHDFDFKTLHLTLSLYGVLFRDIPLPVGHPLSQPDLLGGIPILDPTYSFGLRYAHAAQPLSPQPAASSALPVIAVVATQARDYDVTLVDEPAIDGVPTYHLRLTPRRKPKDNRLRELWVGTQDYLPRQAIISGNFTVAPLVDVPWLVKFVIIDGAPYIADELTDATLYLAHRRVVHDAAVAFQNVREPDGSIVDEPLVAPNADATNLVEP
jgi:hypothetical protein